MTIRLHDRLLLILSEHSMTAVGQNGDRQGRKREDHEQRRMLFPVRIVSRRCATGSSMRIAARIPRGIRFIINQWKASHDHYEAALKRLRRSAPDQ
jgi:hypothetical protein